MIIPELHPATFKYISLGIPPMGLSKALPRHFHTMIQFVLNGYLLFWHPCYDQFISLNVFYVYFFCQRVSFFYLPFMHLSESENKPN